MMHPAHIIFRLRVWLGLALVLFCCSPVWAATRDEDVLHQLRHLRRQQHQARQLAADKDDGPLLFGLLVIPVDFADARLPENWDPPAQLGPRLLPDEGESLRHYFRVASREKLDLRITTAPVIHLPLGRREYSDIGYQGYSRTRALATESLQAVRDLGLEFRSLDMDGPDRLPGTADDDGQVDGVLILHAGIGQENDPDQGLIQPLQFFLEDPVVSGGIRASFYAVASLASGPGIWAHETGHLLGMEDRYDPLLHPDPQGADVRSLGGLGRFSLMGSGAWGSGEGWGAALPDAYTCMQLGWYPVSHLPPGGEAPFVLQPGMAARIWTRGETGPEFFLMETRDPLAQAPFDAGLPAGQLLIYHIDETVPEGSWSDDGAGQWHLRARLVEADADGRLAAGLDDGRAEDLFPGPLGVAEFGPATVPDSWGYHGNSHVRLLDITPGQGSVQFLPSAHDGPAFDVQLSFTGSPLALLHLAAVNRGEPVDTLTGRLEVLSGSVSGSFAGGGAQMVFSLDSSDGDRWFPDQEISFLLDSLPGPGDWTGFSLTLTAGSWTSGEAFRTWIWSGEDDVLDFDQGWPAGWTITDLTPGTTWHRWVGPPYLDARESAILVATGDSYSSPGSWPAVLYGNRAHTSLNTPLLGPHTQAVRMIHALGTERLATGEAMDGGRLQWQGPEGTLTPALPEDTYPTRINPAAVNPLGGQAVFADTLLTDETGQVIWQVDVVPLPDEPGPWSLTAEFASNTLWRRQGWLVADLRALTDWDRGSAFPLDWDPGQGLAWAWPHPDLPVAAYCVQERSLPTSPWTILAEGLSEEHLEVDRIVSSLGPSSPTRHEVRVLALTAVGPVASRPVVIYADGGYRQSGILGPARPNPTRGQVSFQVQVSAGQSRQLSIYDLRGRLVHRRSIPAGSYLLTWDGSDDHGRRLPAGVYFLRLEGSGPVPTRKVVLLR